MRAVVHPNALANALFNAHEVGKTGEVSVNVGEGAVRCYGRSRTAMLTAYVAEEEDIDPAECDFDPSDEVTIEPEEMTALQSALRKKSKAQGATVSIETDGERLVVYDGDMEEASLPTLGLDARDAMSIDEECRWAISPPWGEREGGALFFTPAALTPVTRVKPAPPIIAMRMPRIGRTIAYTAGPGVYGLMEALDPNRVTDQRAVESTPWLRPAVEVEDERDDQA